MSEFPVPIGHEAAITVFRDEEVLCGIVQKRTGSHTVECDIYTETDEAAAEALALLASAVESLQYRLHRPEIRAQIKHITEMMRKQIAEEEGEPPSPTDDVGDIPF